MPGVFVGQHETLFEGQQDLSPFATPDLGVHDERTHAQRGRPTPALPEHRLGVGGAFGEQATRGKPHADEDQGDREFVGDVLEVVADLDPTLGPHPQEVQVIYHQ